MIWLKAILATAFFAAPAYAQNEAGDGTRDFSGGLNELVEKSKMPENASPALMNVLVDEKIGALVPRSGLTQCGVTPSGNPATRLYEYARTNGTRRLIVTDNTTVWETANCTAFTTIVDNLDGAVPDFATVRDDLWIVNRDSHVIVWDGSNATPLDGRASTPSPAPPKCAYLEFWRERVWCARTNSNPSDVAFSALTDSSGNDITPSTGSAAWPATNVISVDEDGGCPIYGIEPYRDRLYVFKGECGIFEIAFENDFNLAVLKTFASVGAKFHTGIIEGDGLLHFVGPDGLYITDMRSNLTRISDVIPTTFDNLRQPSAGEGLSVWTSQEDFADTDAVSFRVSTTILPGSILLSTTAAIIDNGDMELGTGYDNFTFSCTASTVTFGDTGLSTEIGTSFKIEQTYGMQITQVPPSASAVSCSANIIVAGSTVTTMALGDQSTASTATLDTSDYLGQTAYINFYMTGNSGTCNVYSDNFTAGTAVTFQYVSDCVNGSPSVRGIEKLDNIQVSNFFASGTYTSEIREIGVTISSWSTFEVTDFENGGGIAYMVRLGTNTGGLQQAAFVDITPGDIINGTTAHTFIQWTATFTYAAPGPVRLDDVTWNYLTGDISDAPIYSGFHENRWWISGATGTSTSNNIVLVKSKSPSTAIVPFDMRVNDFAHFNNNFYTAASTHSGIYRADFGTNDNGAAIQWHWESKEFDFGSPYTKNTLKEIIMDYRNGSATNAKLGYKRNDQTTYTEVNANLSQTGRSTIRKLINGGLSHGFQFRIRDASLDETAEIIGLGAYSIPGRIRE